MKKRIGIEAQGIFSRNKSNIEIAALELIKQLEQAEATDLEFFIFVRPGPVERLTSSRNIKIIKLQSVTAAFWEQVVLPAAIQKHKIKLLHCTGGTAPLDAGIPLILTFKNLKSSNWLVRLYRRWIVPRVIKRAQTVIVYSEAEKDEAKAVSGRSGNVMIADKSRAGEILALYRSESLETLAD